MFMFICMCLHVCVTACLSTFVCVWIYVCMYMRGPYKCVFACACATVHVYVFSNIRIKFRIARHVRRGGREREHWVCGRRTNVFTGQLVTATHSDVVLITGSWRLAIFRSPSFAEQNCRGVSRYRSLYSAEFQNDFALSLFHWCQSGFFAPILFI